MPSYTFTCKHCGNQYEKFVPISEYQDTDQCKCGELANHDFVADHAGGNADSQMREYSFDGDTGTRMYSAAYLPNQKEEAKRNHPGREFKEVNGCLLPVIKHRRDKLQFLKEKSHATGQEWVEF